MKKKLLSLLIAVCLFVPCMFMLTACGTKGTYTLSGVQVEGVTYTADDPDNEELDAELAQMLEGLFGEDPQMSMSIELKGGDKCVMKSTFGEETMETEGTWELDGETLKITTTEEDGDTETVELVCKDGKIYMEQGDYTFVLSK